MVSYYIGMVSYHNIMTMVSYYYYGMVSYYSVTLSYYYSMTLVSYSYMTIAYYSVTLSYHPSSSPTLIILLLTITNPPHTLLHEEHSIRMP